MMHKLLTSLKDLSGAAAEALPLLEKYNYRKEARTDMDKHLSMDVLPKPLREIVDSVLIYCTPLIDHDDNLPSDALLCSARRTFRFSSRI